MVQMARNESSPGSESAKEGAEKIGSLAKDTAAKTADIGKAGAERVADTAEQARESTARLGQRTAATAESIMSRPMDTTRQMFTLPTRAATEMFKIEGQLTHMWLELASEQMAQNAEMLNRLAAARDWRETLELQNSFVRESLSRMTEGMSRHLDLAGSMMTRVLQTSQDEIGKAA